MTIHGFETQSLTLKSLWRSLASGLTDAVHVLDDQQQPLPTVEGSLTGLGNHRIDKSHLPSAWV